MGSADAVDVAEGVCVADGSAVAVEVEAPVGSAVGGCGVSVSVRAGTSVSVAVSVGVSVGRSVAVASWATLEAGPEAAWATIKPSRLKPRRLTNKLRTRMKFKKPVPTLNGVRLFI